MKAETRTLAVRDEPDWLQGYRERNAKVFVEKPFKKSLYTDVQAWERWLESARPAKPGKARVTGLEGQAGLRVLGWAEALQSHGPQVRAALEAERPPKEQFEAFINANFVDAYVITVVGEVPGMVSWTVELPAGTPVKAVVLVEANASAKLLETLSGSGTLFAETVSVGRNADVKLARAHQEQGNALVYQQLALEGDARLQNFNLWTEAESLRGCTAARLIGRGAAFEQLDAMLAGGRQKFDLNQVTVHEATDSTSRSSLRNALLGRSVGVFDGMIKIPPSGQKTDSMLEAHSMLLSDQASSNNIPGLEIEADDVKAAHSASVVHVEEEPLFYLLSRGLALEEAREMVVMGFLESLLRRLPEGFQEGLEAALDRKWRQLTAPGEGSA